MTAPIDVSVSRTMPAPPERVRRMMFDARQDPQWMAAVRAVEPLGEEAGAGARVRRTIRWTTEVVAADVSRLELRIVDGPMRGTVIYRVEPAGGGSRVTIQNVGEAPGFAPRPLLAWAMRRALAADLERLQRAVESTAG